jgi:hypothetical protein
MKSKNTNQKAIVFTTHKAGSMLVHRVLQDICKKNDIDYYSPNQDPEKQVPFERIFNGEDFIAERNGYFGPLRFFVPSAALNEANIVLHLRDPRDVLTSMFFSYCYMHPGEIDGNTGYRKEVAEAGIDKFVLDMTDENCLHYRGEYGTGNRFTKYVGNIRDRYLTYLREVFRNPNATILSYEEMVLDFANWLKQLIDAFELADSNRTYRALMVRHGDTVKPVGENVWSHKRKVTPGDYKEKLRPETIATLNSRFSEALDALGYSDADYETRRIPSPHKGQKTEVRRQKSEDGSQKTEN